MLLFSQSLFDRVGNGGVILEFKNLSLSANNFPIGDGLSFIFIALRTVEIPNLYQRGKSPLSTIKEVVGYERKASVARLRPR